MIIRPATLKDINALMRFALEQAELYPQLKPNERNMRVIGVEMISSAAHYAMVGLDENRKVGAAIMAHVQNSVWAQRQHAAVALWVSKIPGGGAELLRGFRDWVLSRRAIKVAGMAPDVDIDPRTWMLTERIGFKRHGGSYLLYN